MNDFENCLEYTTLNMYADYIYVNIAPVNLNELLEDLKIELDNISNRMRNKKLCLNASKSEYILIAHKRWLKRTGNGSGVARKYSLGILSFKDIIGGQGRTQH